MTLRHGWIIVCPDGQSRHFPYGNHGDAQHDAEYYSTLGCTNFEHGKRIPTGCPNGEHTVAPHAFQPPAPRGSA